MDEITAEQIAQDYKAMGDSVELLNAGQPEDMDDAEWEDCVQRNVDHLKIMVAKDFWTNEDMTAANAAIAVNE
jgi:secreted Zn-dependent insulinase-like peptidase